MGITQFYPLYENQWNIWLGHPHNLFLMFTAETGVIGIIFLSSFVGWIMVKNIILLKQLSRKNVASLFPEDRLILFTYLIAFGSCILFNCFDVSLFDLRVNIFTWLLLFALGGIIKVFDYENT
jgi:O-antigen ligase